jgi:hypothetical protein
MSCKYNIILDLDETLFSGEEIANLHDRSIETDFEDIWQGRDYVFIGRPGLQPFLDFLFLNFNVGIWTAANRAYAKRPVDELILKPNPSRRLLFFLTRDDYAKYNPHQSTTKFISWMVNKFNLSMCNTILIDNSKTQTNIASNFKNAIKVDDFRVYNPRSFKPIDDSIYDSVLYELMIVLESLLDKNEDLIEKCDSGDLDLPCPVQKRDTLYVGKKNEILRDVYQTMRRKMSTAMLQENIRDSYLNKLASSNPLSLKVPTLPTKVRHELEQNKPIHIRENALVRPHVKN